MKPLLSLTAAVLLGIFLGACAPTDSGGSDDVVTGSLLTSPALPVLLDVSGKNIPPCSSTSDECWVAVEMRIYGSAFASASSAFYRQANMLSCSIMPYADAVSGKFLQTTPFTFEDKTSLKSGEVYKPDFATGLIARGNYPASYIKDFHSCDILSWTDAVNIGLNSKKFVPDTFPKVENGVQHLNIDCDFSNTGLFQTPCTAD